MRVLPAAVLVMSGALLGACSDGGARTPFTAAASTGTPTEPNEGTPTETTGATQQQPTPQPTSTGTTEPPPPPPPECKKAAPSNACGVVPQCGCAPTETCDVADSAGNAACVSAGKAPMGNACTATSGCGVGLTCIGGTCHAFCNNPGNACTLAGTGACAQIKTQSGTVIPNLSICRVACAPHDPMSCGGKTVAGTGVCVVGNDGNTDCQTAGTRVEGEACTPTDDCGPALVCVTPATGTSTCKKWCRVGQADCGTGKTCTGFKTAVMVSGVEYGACP